jgi:hypothetical protein
MCVDPSPVLPRVPAVLAESESHAKQSANYLQNLSRAEPDLCGQGVDMLAPTIQSPLMIKSDAKLALPE